MQAGVELGASKRWTTQIALVMAEACDLLFWRCGAGALSWVSRRVRDSNLHRPGLSWMGEGRQAVPAGILGLHKATLLSLLVTGLSDTTGKKMPTQSNLPTTVSGLDACPAQAAPE